MAPPPLATPAAAAAAAADLEDLLEVRCGGCGETLEVERGLTEFVCPDCATPQSLPPELMPPPRRRALPLPRAAADARGARLPCGACGQLLSVPVGLSRCACPLCGAELTVDSARLRNYILSSAAASAAVVPRSAASVPPIVSARETWQERPSYAMRTALPRAEPDAWPIPPRRTQVERPGRLIHVHRDEQEYPYHVIDGEEIPVANETAANNSLQRNQPSLGRRIIGNEERQVLRQNEVRGHVNGQHPSNTIQPQRAQLAPLHRVIHSEEEMQDRPPIHEVYREARHTELIYEVTATQRNQRVGCSTDPQTPSIGERDMGTPTQTIQKVHKQPYHDIHAEGCQIGRMDLDGVVRSPVNQANHGEEASTEMINNTPSRESICTTGCSVGPKSVSVEKRKVPTTNQVKQHMQKQQSDATRAERTQKEHPDQAICEPINCTTNREAMYSLPIKETTARCSKQGKPKFVNTKTIAKKRHMESLNHNIQQAEGQTSDNDSHEIQIDVEHQGEANKRHGNASTLKESEQVTPPNKLTDLKQKNVRTNDEIQKEQIEVDVSKQTSGSAQKKNRKGSIAYSNAGFQLRRSERLAKDSVAAIEYEPLESDPSDLQDFDPNVQVDAMDDEPTEWEPIQQRSTSPNSEVSVATSDTDSAESEEDEDYVVSPDQSMSESDHSDTDTPFAHKVPQKTSDERDDPDLTTYPSVPDMSDPEHFARNYIPLEVRRALAEEKYNLTDPEEQPHSIKGKRPGGRLCVKVWTLPKGVQIPVSFNTSGLPVGENANMLISFLGALARDGVLAPLTYVSWKKIPKENKDVLWHIIKLKFDVDPSHELSVLGSIRIKWRGWKCHLKLKHYDPHTTEEERLADLNPRAQKEQWRVLVAYWNTDKAKARSAAGKASRAKSTYISKTGSKSFARILQEESQSGDPALENPEASAMGSERRDNTRKSAGPSSPKDLQEKSASQAARAKRKAGDEASTPRKKVLVTQENRPKYSQESAVLEAARAKRRAEDEAAALRKKVIVMEESQKKLQEDLARVTDAMSAMQKMMSTGHLRNGLMCEPAMPPNFEQERDEASFEDVSEPYIVYSGLHHPSSHNQQTQ